jgi:hypothetical protein
MSKKEKVIIKNEELEPTTLGKVTENKVNMLPLILVLVIFLVAIVFAPTVQAWYENYTKGTVANNNTSITSNKTTSTTNNEETETVTKYDYKDNLEISNDKVKISNILIKDNKLSYTVTNLTSTYLNLANYNYYLEFYNNDTLMARRMIEKVGLQKNVSNNYSYDFNYTGINKVVFRNIDKTEYPEVTINVDSNKKGTLICIKDTETITYYFLDNKLYSINDVLIYASSKSDYSAQYAAYQKLATTYSTITGFNATITNTTTGFTYNVTIDLTTAKLTTVNNSNYYANETGVSIVNFEEEANGFTCN